MSSHYKTQDPLPDDLITKLVKRLAFTSHLYVYSEYSAHVYYSRYANVGLFYLRQLVYATFDLVVHDNSLDVNTDYTKLWNELRQQIAHLKGGDRPGQGSFKHIAGEYDVGYYGYVISVPLECKWNRNDPCIADTPIRSCSPQTCMQRYSRKPPLIPSWVNCTVTRFCFLVGHGTRWICSRCVRFPMHSLPNTRSSLLCVRTFWDENRTPGHLSTKLS